MKNYNLKLEDFDLNLLLDPIPKLIETSNYSTINELCKDVQNFSNMAAVVGEPGYGKTVALTKYSQNNENVFYITVKKSMSAKIFYNELLSVMGFKNNHQQSNVYYIIDSIVYHLKELNQKSLIIIDEAGKLSHTSLLYLHDLRDSVKNTTGIVIAGPQYFENNVLIQLKKNVEGIPELYRRITSWIRLEEPNYKEKFMLCKYSGIKNEHLINVICNNSEYKTLSDISNLLSDYRNLLNRIQSEK